MSLLVSPVIRVRLTDLRCWHFECMKAAWEGMRYAHTGGLLRPIDEVLLAHGHPRTDARPHVGRLATASLVDQLIWDALGQPKLGVRFAWPGETPKQCARRLEAWLLEAWLQGVAEPSSG